MSQSKPRPHDLVVAILAGGAGRRMRYDKALLRLPDGRTTCAVVLQTARQVAERVVLLVDTEEHGERVLRTLTPPVPEVLLDERPGTGPLGALAGALRAAPESALLLLAVDMPLIQAAVLRELSTQLRDRRSEGACRIVAPLIDGMAQPMPACYDTRLADEAAKLLRTGRCDLRALLEDSGVAVHRLPEADLRAMDPDLRSFSGANTPEEWEKIRAWVEQGDPAAGSDFTGERMRGGAEQAGDLGPTCVHGPHT